MMVMCHSAVDPVPNRCHLECNAPWARFRDERNRRRQLLWWREELGPLRLADLTSAAIVQGPDKLARSTGCKY